MKEVSVVRKKKNYRSFAFVSAGLVREKAAEGLVFSSGVNLDFSGGKMVSGLGVKGFVDCKGQTVVSDFSCESMASLCVYFENGDEQTGANACALLKNGRLLFYSPERRVFIQKAYGFSAENILLPVHQKGSPALIAMIGEDGVRVVRSNGETTTVYLDPVPCCGAFFHGRIFFAEGFAIRCSAPFDFDGCEESADEACRIELGAEDGEILAIIACGERLFVVRQHAVLEVLASGAARDFVVKKVAYGGGEIQKGGVCAVGESLVFLALDGVYRYLNGNFVRLVSGNLKSLVGDEKIVASAAGNRYRLGYTNGSGEKTALVVNIEDGNYYFSFGLSGVQGGGMTVGGRDYAILLATDRGELPAGEECVAYARKVDFGESGEKVVRKLTCYGHGEVEIAVRSSRGEKRASFSLEGTENVEFALKGREFELEVRLQSGAMIESFEVEYDLVGGGK